MKYLIYFSVSTIILFGLEILIFPFKELKDKLQPEVFWFVFISAPIAISITFTLIYHYVENRKKVN